MAFREVSRKISTRRAVPLDWVLGALGCTCFVVAVGLAATHSGDELWMKTAQWNLVRGVPPVLSSAIALRQSAITAALLGGAWLTAFALLVWRWRVTRGNRWRGSVVALMVCELLLTNWREARPFSNDEFQRSAQWPGAITRRFAPGDRWVSDWSGKWHDNAWNFGVPAGVDLYNGYDPFTPGRFFKLASRMEGVHFYDNQYQPKRYGPLLRVAGVTHLLSAPGTVPQTIAGDRPERVAASGAWTLWRYHEAWPRVYLTTNIVRASEEKQPALLDNFARQKLEGEWPVVANASDLSIITPGENPGRVVQWSRTLNRMTVRLDMTNDAVLVVGENYWPGWHAYERDDEQDFVEQPVRCANVQFRGVAVPAGTKTVTWVYEPQVWRLALFLGLLGLGTTAGTLINLKRQT